MIKSMTGFGRGYVGRGKNKIEVEIQSVNSRFLEIKFRGLVIEQNIEHKIRKLLDEIIIRGNVVIYISCNKNQESQKIVFNKERFKLIQETLKNIHVTFGQRLSLSDIISTNDLLKIDENVLINNNTLIKAVEIAIAQLNDMRKNEGISLYNDINNRLEYLKKTLNEVKITSNQYKNETYKSLYSKIDELLSNNDIDDTRLIQEVAYYVERADVTEEIVRCLSHFDQLSKYIKIKEPVGKRINFLLQEIGREINTIGSKSPQTDITMKVVEMKGELEKIREQTQNIL